MATIKERTYKCRLWLPGKTTVDLDIKGTEKLAPNFAAWELANTSAKESVKLVMTENSWKFLAELQTLRDRYFKTFGKGLDLSSFYRTATYNRSCGGSSNSAHLDARAADIIGIPQSRYEQITTWWRDITAAAGKTGGINYYADNRVHITDFEQKFGHSQFYIRDYRRTGK